MLDLQAQWARQCRIPASRKPVALDSSLFESGHVSRHFEKRCVERASPQGTSVAKMRGKAKTRGDQSWSQTIKRLPKLSLAVASLSHLILANRAIARRDMGVRSIMPAGPFRPVSTTSLGPGTLYKWDENALTHRNHRSLPFWRRPCHTPPLASLSVHSESAGRVS
jgi:hypothetical protein